MKKRYINIISVLSIFFIFFISNTRTFANYKNMNTLLAQSTSGGKKINLPLPVQLEKKAVSSLRRSGRILLNFESADIRVVAKLISELTHKNIIMDQRVKGKITILSSRQVTPKEAWSMFVSALQAYGFDVVDWGKTAKIIPLKKAAREKSRFYSESNASKSNQYLVAVIGLKHADPTQLANVLKPLATSEIGVVIPYKPSHSILVADESHNVKKLIKIARHLDTKRQKPLIKTFYLKNSVSTEVVKSLHKLYPQGISKSETFRGAIISDYPMYNAILVMATNDLLTEINALIKDMDRKLELKNIRKFRVIQLQNATAKDVAKILGDMLKEGARVQRKTTKITRPTVTGKTTTQPATRNWPAAGPANANTTVSGTESQVTTFTSNKVSADEDTNSIVLYVTDAEMNMIKPMIARLDAPRKQVLVSAIIAEVSEKRTKTTGANWQVITKDGVGASFGGGKSLDAIYQILASGNFILGGIGNRKTSININGRVVEFPDVFALIQFLNEDNDFQVLSTPRVLTMDHKEAQMNVGSIVPFASGIKFDANGQPIITYDYKDVGLNLKVTPHIGQGKFVRLEIEQKIQDVTDYIQQNLGAIGYVVPVVSNRNVDTTISLGDSQTVVIGGLVSRKTINSIKKIPVLGSIPVIGAAFRNTKKEVQKTTLFIFITPHVIESPQELVNLNEKYQDYLKSVKLDPLSAKPIKNKK